MKRIFLILACFAAVPLFAQKAGTASGKGTFDDLTFSPKFAYAYAEGSGAKRSTWIVLTVKELPSAAWSAKDRQEVRQTWCAKEKTPFVALKLDADNKVDLYFLCSANGAMSTEMLSTWNGLDSVVVKFTQRDALRLKGGFRTGSGSCPAADGSDAYCTPTGDYTFDAPLTK